MTGFRPWSSRLAHTAPVGVAGSHCIPLSIPGCTYALPEPQKLFVFNLFSIAYFRSIVKPDEDTQLEARRRLLQNAEKLSDGLRDAAACLDGGDEAQGAAALLTQAERDLAHSARFDESLQPLHDTIADLMYQAQDAAEQLRDRLYRLSYSADELEQLEERLDLLHRLRRKYGADCASRASCRRTRRSCPS